MTEATPPPPTPLMTRRTLYPALLWLSLALGASGDDRGADGPHPDPAPPDLKGSQVGLRLAGKQFQATVIAKEADALTVVTAAHCLSADDEGQPVRVHGSAGDFVGRVASVCRNPAYRPIKSRDPRHDSVRGTLAVDSAVATIRLGPRDEPALRGIRPADLTARPVPDAPGRMLTVHVVDQRGVEHAVRAGNHLNPKCLAWGNRAYRPTPGDSGAGVFLVVKAEDGSARPVLIGNVALVDDRGGIAPLICRQARWVGVAVARREPTQ